MQKQKKQMSELGPQERTRGRWAVVHNVLGLEVTSSCDESSAPRSWSAPRPATDRDALPRTATATTESHRIDPSSSEYEEAEEADTASSQGLEGREPRSERPERSASREIRQLLIQSVAIVGLGAWTAAGVLAMLAAHRDASHRDGSACWVVV